jgi:hypothetical protein
MQNTPKINLENYEIFIIDYLDHQLSNELMHEFMAFLEAHPLINEEIKGLEDFKLQAPASGVFDKDLLKKSEHISPPNIINTNNLDEFIIANQEAQLQKEELEALRVYLLAHPEAEKTQALIRQTTMKPNFSTRWPDKKLLYRLAVESTEPINNENIDEFIVGFYEGTLNAERTIELKSFLSIHTKAQAIFEHYSQIKMKADTNIIFEAKDNLKRKEKLLFFNQTAFRYVASLAAVLLVFLMFPSLLRNGEERLDFQTPQFKPIKNASDHHNEVFVDEISNQNLKKTYIAKARKKDLTNKTDREQIVIAKAAPMEPEVKIKHPSITQYQKPDYCFASDSPYNGYYEVTMAKSNFINQNPDLTKRLIKGVRNMLNINPEDINASDTRLTIWDVADVGIKGFNVLTESEATISHR